MNDQISADLQRLIGRVWMAAFEAGKREALEPKDPDTMRREALAAALAQDGADDRVVGDWTAVGDGRVTEFPIPAAGEPGTPVDVTPIRRADVRLKVGDVVTCEDWGGGMVEEVTHHDGDNTWIRFGGMNSRAYYASGRYFIDRDDRGERITTLNGRPIIDSEEA